MKKNFNLSLLFFSLFALLACNQQQTREAGQSISHSSTEKVQQKLLDKYGKEYQFRIERGVQQVADLWTKEDGNSEDFAVFCEEYFVADADALEALYNRIERNLEIVQGQLHKIDVQLKEPIQLTGWEASPVDMLFASWDATAHLQDDFYKNKIAFVAALNFPFYTLQEKTELGENWSRKEWAYARMGDAFTSRTPADVQQFAAETLTKADNYISNYNIKMGSLLNDNGESLFPENMSLITHWGLRDELKSNYADTERGLEKQEMVYQVMKRIIDQSIPADVINNADYQWNPYSNEVSRNGEKVDVKPEGDIRYATLMSNFNAMRKLDNYSTHYPNAIERNFNQQMEIPVEDVKTLFDGLLSSPQVKKVAQLMAKRLGRELRPFDIWYDGFKERGEISESYLDQIIAQKYPNPMALEKDLPNIMMKLGWTPAEANRIASLVQVDPSTGAGHAWGAVMKDDKARLRTRVAETGMDYKGYNIAVHEFGHNVEQTITLYDVDYWMLRGVPNNAFTEAVAFLFQKRDLDVMGMASSGSQADALLALDSFWSSFEIMGVALVDIAVWEWMYANPNASPAQLKEAVIDAAKEVWNKYYAGILGDNDEPILAIYSHMIDYPLYLAYYPIGHLISFQVEQAMKGKNIADEMQRMYTQGRIIPQVWMKNAVGREISTEPLLNAVDEALKVVE